MKLLEQNVKQRVYDKAEVKAWKEVSDAVWVRLNDEFLSPVEDNLVQSQVRSEVGGRVFVLIRDMVELEDMKIENL